MGASRFCASCGAVAAVDSFETQTVAVPRSANAARERRPPSTSRAQGRFASGELLGGRYRIVAMLGKGGMGEVYRAEDLSLDQPVALKFLPEAATHNDGALTRLRSEVRIARQVSHPNVCRVYDLGEMEGLYFLSMEYVDGEDLGSLLRRIGRLPGDKAIEIARKLCAGLAAAHERGVLHRDLKPGNIMLDGRGQVLLTDFGLAGLAGEVEGADVRNGTPGYMAPEQLAGQEVTFKSDIYALGLVLYEIFTGKLPFESDTLAGLMRAQRENLPVSPSTIARDLEPTVDNVILRCLNPRPAMRPGSALAVAAAFPGGDPLAAALAAGETPSPEMVAAAGTQVGLQPRRALAWLTAVLLGLGVACLTHQETDIVTKIPFDQSPEVLAGKAQDMLAQLGYPERPSSRAFGFGYRYEPLRYLMHALPGSPWPRLAKGRPATVRFWYRSSPAPLAPREISDVIHVDQNDPPNVVPGMRLLYLDPQGRLLYLEAVPPAFTDSTSTEQPAPWRVLFQAAGLDLARFKPVTPQWPPGTSSDAWVAWSGSYPEAPEIAIHVEAASFRGKPVYFAQYGPWSTPATPAQASGDEKPTGDVVYIVLQLIVILASIPFARYNLRLGRGDTRGAIRLGLFATSIGMLAWLIGGAHVGNVKETDLFFMAVMRALFGGVSIAVTYISFEPFVRRRWPQTIISWSRLLAGGFRDPLVGRDVLVGAALGLVLSTIQGVGALSYGLLGFPIVRTQIRYSALAGGRSMVGESLYLIDDALYKTLGILFLIFLARTLLRSQWLTAGVITVALAGILAPNEPSPLIGWPVNLIFFGVMVLILMRCGLLSLVVAMFISIFVGSFPLGTDFSVWYVDAIWFTIAVVLAPALLAFRVARADQPLFVERLAADA